MLVRRWHLPVLLLVVGVYSSADAAVLCSNASGSVFVRTDVCRAGEAQLDPVALGLRGPAGADGADGVSGWELLRGSSGEVAPRGFGQVTLTCPAGKQALGGGHSSLAGGLLLVGNFFTTQDGRSGWQVTMENNTSHNIDVHSSVVCATVLEETA